MARDLRTYGMEAAWQPLSSKPSLPTYDTESDPFCPLAVARRFNQLQRKAAAAGTQSLIDLTPVARKKKTRRATARRCSRPKSSGGRMEAVPPLLAGAIIELRDGGGFTAFRRPPLRSKGLPSATQVNKGLARSAKERRSPPRNSSNEKSGAKQGRGHAAELTADTKAEFSTLLERRDDILQDVWLKMHSGDGFARIKGDLARLLSIYRSASLEVVEAMMRHPQLEKVADAFTKKKGEGMQSYRELVAQDADFADGIPEAITWLGFTARRNPLFLPPKTTKPSSEIGFNDATDLERLRDAQEFILAPESFRAESTFDSRNSLDGGCEITGGTKMMYSCDGRSDNNTATISSVPRTRRDKLRTLIGQLAIAQETISDLEASLRSLETEREKNRGRAAKAREAATEAGRQKRAQRMYRLRGTAAFLEEDVEELDGEITARRVRLFSEKLDVARKRMLKDTLAAEIAEKPRAPRRRKRSKKDASATLTIHQPSTVDVPQACPTRAEGHRRQDTSAAIIQAQVRGAQVRVAKLETSANAANEDKYRREAAVRIEAADRGAIEEGALVVPETEMRPRVGLKRGAEDKSDRSWEEGETPEESKPTTEARLAAAVVATEVPGPEKLDDMGVQAVFDSLEPGAIADHLRRRQHSSTTGRDCAHIEETGKIFDGAELARTERAPDPHTELLAIGANKCLGLRATGSSAVGALPSVEMIKPQPSNQPASGSYAASIVPAAGVTALSMVQRLCREQKFVADALRGMASMSGMGSEFFNERVRVGNRIEIGGSKKGNFVHAKDEPKEEDNLNADEPLAGAGEEEEPEKVSVASWFRGDEPARSHFDGSVLDGILEGGGRKVVTNRVAAFSLPPLLLPEIEAALSAQLRLSTQAREVLKHCAKIDHSVSDSEEAMPHGPPYTNTRSTLEL